MVFCIITANLVVFDSRNLIKINRGFTDVELSIYDCEANKKLKNKPIILSRPYYNYGLIVKKSDIKNFATKNKEYLNLYDLNDNVCSYYFDRINEIIPKSINYKLVWQWIKNQAWELYKNNENHLRGNKQLLRLSELKTVALMD